LYVIIILYFYMIIINVYYKCLLCSTHPRYNMFMNKIVCIMYFTFCTVRVHAVSDHVLFHHGNSQIVE
jgi:hypothetical protein